MLLRKFEMPENNVLIIYKTKKKQSAAGRVRTRAILSELTARQIIDLVQIWDSNKTAITTNFSR